MQRQPQEVRVILSLLVLFTACEDNTSHGTQSEPVTTVDASAKGLSLAANDFDLAAVVGLIESGQIGSAAELEEKINDASTGINNVDVDADGKVDYVGAVEQTGLAQGKYGFELVATGSTSGDKVPVATVTIDTTTKSVEAGYPSYVSGHGSHYYHHSGISFGDAMLISWLMSPRPMYMYSYPTGYYAQPVMGYSDVSNRRISYSSTTKTTTVSPTAKPSTYSDSATASKVKSTYSTTSSKPTSFSTTSSTNKAKTGSGFSSSSSSKSTGTSSSSSSSGSSGSGSTATSKPSSSGSSWGKSSSTSKPSSSSSRPSSSRPSSSSRSSGRRR